MDLFNANQYALCEWTFSQKKLRFVVVFKLPRM